MNQALAEQTLLNWAVVKVMNYFWRSSKLGRTFVKPKSSLTSTYLRHVSHLRLPEISLQTLPDICSYENFCFCRKTSYIKIHCYFIIYIAVTAVTTSDYCIIKRNFKNSIVQCDSRSDIKMKFHRVVFIGFRMHGLLSCDPSEIF